MVSYPFMICFKFLSTKVLCNVIQESIDNNNSFFITLILNQTFYYLCSNKFICSLPYKNNHICYHFLQKAQFDILHFYIYTETTRVLYFAFVKKNCKITLLNNLKMIYIFKNTMRIKQYHLHSWKLITHIFFSTYIFFTNFWNKQGALNFIFTRYIVNDPVFSLQSEVIFL